MTFFLHKAAGVQSTGGFWSFGITTQGSISEAAAETAWGGAIAAFFGTSGIAALFSTGTTLTLTSTSTASATFRQTTKTTTTHAVSGTAAGAMLPEYCSIVASLYSAEATRYGRGRWFLPSPAAAILAADTSGHLNAADVTTLADGLTTLFTSLSTAGITPVLVTRKATVSGAAQYSTRAVTSGSIPNQLQVQNRRGDKIIPSRTSFTP